MSKYDKVKEYYKKGLWNETRVKNAVVKGWITQDEYHKIITECQKDA